MEFAYVISRFMIKALVIQYEESNKLTPKVVFIKETMHRIYGILIHDRLMCQINGENNLFNICIY